MHPNFARYTGRVFVSASILLAVAGVVLPQRSGRPAESTDPNDPANQERTNKTDLRNREWLLENTRKPVRKPGLGPSQSAAPQIQADFERIQFINRDMMKSVLVDTVVDHKQIRKTVGEIRKRATRLKENLAYPEAENPHDANAPAPGYSDIRQLLVEMDNSLMSFVTNPIFQLNQQVVKADLARKASADLRSVIEYSNKITKLLDSSNKQ